MPDPHRRPIPELLTDAASEVASAFPADTQGVLRALWHGFCVVAVAGRALAAGGEQAVYPPRWRRAQPVLATAIGVLCRAPSLPAELVIAVNLAGGPDDWLPETTAWRLHAGVLSLAAELATLAAAAARYAAGADAQACRHATVLADELLACYARSQSVTGRAGA